MGRLFHSVGSPRRQVETCVCKRGSDQLSFLHGKMRGGNVTSRLQEGFRLYWNEKERLDRGVSKHGQAPECLETQVGSHKQEHLERC